MSAPIHSDVFADVINSLMQELHPLARSFDTIFHLLAHNTNSPVLAEIQQLSLSWLNAKKMAALLPAFTKMVQLTSLSLTWCKFSPNHLQFLFTECPALSKLQFLSVERAMVSSQDLLLLSQSTTITNLTSLSLKGCSITESRGNSQSHGFSSFGGFSSGTSTDSHALAVLFSSPVVKNIAHLDLHYINITPEVFMTIATSPHLTKLDLSYCYIGNEGYAALAASTALTNLRELKLSNNYLLEPAAIIALVNSPVMANVTHLDLTKTHRGPEVLAAIAKSPSMSKLQHLRVEDNAIGNEGVIALAQSTTLTNLTSLDLTSNRISSVGINALCTSPVVSKLESLRLDSNFEINNSVAATLASPSSTLYSIIDLILCSVKWDDKALAQVLTTPNFDQLRTLVLDGAFCRDPSIIDAYQTRFNCRLFY
jgi:hypothetical protein